MAEDRAVGDWPERRPGLVIIKRLLFYAVTLTPLFTVVAAGLYLMLLTNLPQLLYSSAIRNILFDCVQFVDDDYVYKMKPGPCRVKNIEYDTVLTHDVDGFRNESSVPPYDVVVIGDSFAHGIGVQDDQTFARLVSSRYHYRVRNLAIGSYATMRELEVLDRYGRGAKYVVLQYCSNDVSENRLSLTLDKPVFRSTVEAWWRTFIGTYNEGKAEGYRKPITQLKVMLRDGTYSSKAAWRRAINQRDMPLEASYVRQILARYEGLLRGKRLVVLEASAWVGNSTGFGDAFDAELSRVSWLSYRIIRTDRILDAKDYFFLDDHINTRGHQKLAAVIADEILRWERADPLIGQPEPSGTARGPKHG